VTEVVVTNGNALKVIEQAAQALAQVETVEQADELWRKVRAVEEAARIAGVYEEAAVNLRRLQLRAKRRYGELLGEGRVGGQLGNKNAAKNDVYEEHIVLQGQRNLRKKARKLAEVPEDLFEEVISAPSVERITEAAIFRAVRSEARRGDLDEQRSNYSKPEGLDLRTGDFREVLSEIADNSVSLIITDPPYVEAAVHLYGELADWANRKLKPGGSCIAYCGQSTMPAALRQMDESLRYWWTIAVEHTTAQRIAGKFVYAEWKPALWFVKESREHQRLVADRLRSDGGANQEKHPWAQDAAQLVPLYEQLSDPGDLIVDPFAGTGSFGLVAVGMNREWIGADLGSATF